MWKELQSEFRKKYLIELLSELKEKESKKILIPKYDDIFKAFDFTPLNKIKVVIIGQDPYPNKDHATGLAFGVHHKAKTVPKSLKNISKELLNETGKNLQDLSLESWANQGVLLLNSYLTTEKNKSLQHHNFPWQPFTDKAISLINKRPSPVVFMLWGKFAQDKKLLISNSIHKILETSHPSPFSANKGFLGCNHFNLCNEFLIANKINPINWV